jgi:hypothetical protein
MHIKGEYDSLFVQVNASAVFQHCCEGVHIYFKHVEELHDSRVSHISVNGVLSRDMLHIRLLPLFRPAAWR